VYPAGAGSPRIALIDVRAPVEVARGALPGAVNMPILGDEERHLVGIAYKESGQEAAVGLGYRLTAGSMAARVAKWRGACGPGPAALSCWRGGMRSQLAQQFLGEPRVPTVEGGYKALRAHLVAGMESSLASKRVIVLTGMTGTGKTDLLESLSGSNGLLALDLEDLARHRGSAFGGLGEQPAQQTFENDLAARILLDPSEVLLMEDESRRIGALHLPDPLYASMSQARLLLLEAPWSERVERIHRQYIVAPAERLGPVRALRDLKAATARLKRRLGGELVERLTAVLNAAMTSQEWRDRHALEPFIAPLLREYYDPLYRRSLEGMQRQVLVRGDREELTSWLTRRA
jgi:tRNA 2-selenouridine synthase